MMRRLIADEPISRFRRPPRTLRGSPEFAQRSMLAAPRSPATIRCNPEASSAWRPGVRALLPTASRVGSPACCFGDAAAPGACSSVCQWRDFLAVLQLAPATVACLERLSRRRGASSPRGWSGSRQAPPQSAQLGAGTPTSLCCRQVFRGLLKTEVGLRAATRLWMHRFMARRASGV